MFCTRTCKLPNLKHNCCKHTLFISLFIQKGMINVNFELTEPVVIWKSYIPMTVQYPWKFILGGKNLGDYNGWYFIVHDSIGHKVYESLLTDLVSMPIV